MRLENKYITLYLERTRIAMYGLMTNILEHRQYLYTTPV